MTRSAWGLALLDDPLAWRMKAACTPADAESFFRSSGKLSAANQRALELCAHCPVQTQCRDHARVNPEPYSRIAGGVVWRKKPGVRG